MFGFADGGECASVDSAPGGSHLIFRLSRSSLRFFDFLVLLIPCSSSFLKDNSSSKSGFFFVASLVSSECHDPSDAERDFGQETLTAVRQLFARRFTDRPLIASSGHRLLSLLLCDLCRIPSSSRAPSIQISSPPRLPRLPLPDPVTQIATLVRSCQSAVRCHKMRYLFEEPPSTCRSGCALDSSPTARSGARRCAGQ